jgi:hypothetical protein
MKPANLCDELGCTREWTVEVRVLGGYSDHSPASSTESTMRLCGPCADRREKKIVEGGERRSVVLNLNALPKSLGQ